MRADSIIEKNGHRSPDARRAAWFGKAFRRAASVSIREQVE
jgi:hypothetical protein